jgi:dissimilatory sulfite reductase (desulfoviridin) alpha/beta subunit
VCVTACREKALSIREDALAINESLCNNCGRCVKACPAEAWKGEPGYLLSFGGTFGNRIAQGRQILPPLKDTATFFRVADAALNFFDKHGKPGDRFLAAIERAGWDAFEKTLTAEARHAC